MYTWRDAIKAFSGDCEGVIPINKDEEYDISNDFKELLKYIDIVIDGPFIEELKILNYESDNVYNNFVGSENQTFWDVKRKVGYPIKIMIKMEELGNGYYS